MSRSTPPTTRQLATQLGVSHTTVALALRNDPGVALATRQRIIAAAEKAGYRSNVLVKALMTQVRQRKRVRPTGDVIAYLTAHHTADHWKATPSVVAQYEGARERAAALGFDVQMMWLGDRGAQSGHVARVLAARGIRGSLLAPVPMDHHTLNLAWNEHSVVPVGYSFSQIALHRAVHHNVFAAFACYKNLRQLGHERIGLVLHALDDVRVHNLWLAGFRGSQPIFGGKELSPHFFPDYDDPRSFLAWYRRARPDAIISIAPHRPLTWLREIGVAVPGEVGFASLDIGANQVGEIAGILQDNRNVGMAAVDLVTGQLFRNEIGIPPVAKVTMIEGVWLDGATAIRRG